MRARAINTCENSQVENNTQCSTHLGGLTRSSVQDQGDNETVQSQNLGENQDQDLHFQIPTINQPRELLCR